MSISSKVQRKLWAASGGFCGNPACHKELFLFSESGKVLNIEEMAHIVGQKEEGPRGDDEMPLSERDEFDNIILLCPACHSMIDKNPDLYPKELVRLWKRNHEESIKSLFITPKFQTRAKLRSYIEPLLAENHAVFEMFGPESENAATHQQTTEREWERQCLQTLIPNNRRIESALINNIDLLSPDERTLLTQFKLHREGFEYNHLTGDVSEVAPLFPRGFDKICL